MIFVPHPCPFTSAVFLVPGNPQCLRRTLELCSHAQTVKNSLVFGSCVTALRVRRHHCHPSSSSKVLPHPRLGAGPGSGAAAGKGVGWAPGLIPGLPSSSLCCFRLLRDQGQGPRQQEGQTGVSVGRRRGGLPGPGSPVPLKCPLSRQTSKCHEGLPSTSFCQRWNCPPAVP